MISFAVDERYTLDLEDDFMVNEDLTLYEFIGDDPVRAFYLGYYIYDWFGGIDRKQQYLYSKQARHNSDDLDKYQKQIEFWSSKYPTQGEEVEMVHLAEYIINNMLWDDETEELDKVKLAFFFGRTISDQQKKQEDEKSDDIH